MKATLQQLLRECLDESSRGGGLDPVKYPSQILGLAEQILFTSQCEDAIKSSSLQQFKIEMEQKLESYTTGRIMSLVHFVHVDPKPFLFVLILT